MNFFLGVFLIIVLVRALKVIRHLERRTEELHYQVMAAKWLKEHAQ